MQPQRGRPPANSVSGERAVLGAVVLATAGALVLRLDHLGSHSLWLDEVITAEAVRYGSMEGALGWARNWVDNTPFLFLITWLLGPLGGSEVAVRLPLAMAGTLTVPAIYALGRAMASRSVGLAAAVLLAAGPFAVYYSQEARAYALVMLFTTLQMLFAYRVGRGPGRRDWMGLAVSTGLALHASHFGLATSASAFAWIALTLWLDRSHRSQGTRTGPSGVTDPLGTSRLKLATFSLAVATVAYVPILPVLLDFLGRQDLGFGRIAAAESAPAEGAMALFAALDARGLALILVAVGMIVACYRSVRASDRGMLLVLVWVGLPLTGMFVLSDGRLLSIWPRYFAFLYPAVVLLAAIGLMSAARAFATITARIRGLSHGVETGGLVLVRRAATVSFAAGAIAIMLADRYPAITRSYETPKGEDNRRAVELIVTASPPGSTLVALGRNRSWLLYSMGYYLWLRGSSTPVLDGAQPGDQGLARLQQPGDLWGIVLHDWNQIPSEPPVDGATHRVHGLTMIRLPDDSGSQLARLDRLLAWGSVFDPEVTGTRKLIGLLGRHPRDGPTIAPPPALSVPAGSAVDGRWVLGSGAALDGDHRGFVIDPDGKETNVTFSTDSPLAGARYALTFDCRGATGSDPRVYVTEGSVSDLESSRASVPVYPSGAGYRCQADGRWRVGGFLFTLSSPRTDITIWLRNAGSEAMFRDVRLEVAP